MFLKLSYPINAFDRRLHNFLKWFRHQRYMAPALWEEICWGLRFLLSHNSILQLDVKTYPLNSTYPQGLPESDVEEGNDDNEEDDEEEEVAETLFDNIERFKKYIFFLIQGSEGPITNDEICQICKRETGLFPKQHMVYLSIHESLTGFICKFLSDRVESMTDEKTIFHILRTVPLPACTNLPPINLKKENSTSSQSSEKHSGSNQSTLQVVPPPPPSSSSNSTSSNSQHNQHNQHHQHQQHQQNNNNNNNNQHHHHNNNHQQQSSATTTTNSTTTTTNATVSSSSNNDNNDLPQSQIITFSTLEEYANYIYSVIEKVHPVRNDIISASCRMDTGVYPRHHFKELGYEGFLTKFIRTYLGRKILSKKCENGDWIHDIMTPEEMKQQINAEEGLEDIDKNISDDQSDHEDPDLLLKGSIHDINNSNNGNGNNGNNNNSNQNSTTQSPNDLNQTSDNDVELQRFKNYIYSVIRSYCGPITFADINSQCIHDLELPASTLLINFGYNEKFMTFVRNYLRSFVQSYHRDSQTYYIATPKIFPNYKQVKLLKSYPLTTLSLFAEFLFSQVIVLGGLNSPVSYHALDTRCQEMINASIQQQLTTLEWRSAPNKFLATYPSGRLLVIILDGVTCIRVKATSQGALSAGPHYRVYDVAQSKPHVGVNNHHSDHSTGRVVHLTK